MARRNIAQDCRDLGQNPAPITERRHVSLGVNAKILRAILLVGGKIDARKLEPCPDFLKYNVGGQRTGARGII